MVAMIRGLKWQRGLLEVMEMSDIGSSRVSGVWYLAGVALARGVDSACGLPL
jgi:hypothetical protein